MYSHNFPYKFPEWHQIGAQITQTGTVFSSIYENKLKNNAKNEQYIKQELIKPQMRWAGTVVVLIGKQYSSKVNVSSTNINETNLPRIVILAAPKAPIQSPTCALFLIPCLQKNCKSD